MSKAPEGRRSEHLKSSANGRDAHALVVAGCQTRRHAKPNRISKFYQISSWDYATCVSISLCIRGHQNQYMKGYSDSK